MPHVVGGTLWAHMEMEEMLGPLLHNLPQASHPFLRRSCQGRLPGIGQHLTGHLQ